MLACGVAVALGFLATDATSQALGARAAALAAGGLLASSLMPFAFERGKEWAGVATVVGFGLTMLNT